MKVVVDNYVFEIRALSVIEQIIVFQTIARFGVKESNVPIELLDATTLARLSSNISQLTSNQIKKLINI